VTFQKERLAFARRRRQVSQTDLARSVGVTARTVQRYEGGQETPRTDKLARIVEELDFPHDFFFDARPLPDIPAPSLSFRAYSKLKARLRENAVTVAQLAVEIEAVLADQFELPTFDVPDLRESATTPEQAAMLLRREWGLGTGPVANMVHLLEGRGVRVFSLTEDAADVDAFCFWHGPAAFVVLNLRKSGERGRFDAAHELGHLTLHRPIDFRDKEVEREADAFASEFLVPREALRAQLPAVITHDTVFKLKRFWKVSAMAMVKRLKDIGHLSDWVYRSMCIRLSRDGYRSGEPGGIDREESSLLPEMIRAEDGVPIGDIARALHVRASEISPLIFNVASARGHLRLMAGVGTHEGAASSERRDGHPFKP
jgi:Zn-dependent peptidase ImmA (M78 family)/DNA-binding XRE family transcriptional regulator